MNVQMSESRFTEILDAFSRLRIGVVGDFFLDKYLLIEPNLDEPSIETGLTAYQIIGKRRSPGAAGTVASNLHALGVGTIDAIGITGVDGEGLELRMELSNLKIQQQFFFAVEERFTPTYIKPMRLENGVEHEGNRWDIKNRMPLPPWIEYEIKLSLEKLIERIDAIMVMDQVSEVNCGVITDRVREKIAQLGEKYPEKIFFADSRERIGLFSNVLIKCNQYELVDLPQGREPSDEQIEQNGWKMVQRTGRSVFVTLGSRGIWVFDRAKLDDTNQVEKIPAIPIDGPIDICGAGDSVSSAIVAALCVGATLCEAAFFGNLAASITIRQIGTTGTATPKQLRQAFLNQTGDCKPKE